MADRGEYALYADQRDINKILAIKLDGDKFDAKGFDDISSIDWSINNFGRVFDI
jgi:hypothetical protein